MSVEHYKMLLLNEVTLHYEVRIKMEKQRQMMVFFHTYLLVEMFRSIVCSSMRIAMDTGDYVFDRDLFNSIVVNWFGIIQTNTVSILDQLYSWLKINSHPFYDKILKLRSSMDSCLEYFEQQKKFLKKQGVRDDACEYILGSIRLNNTGPKTFEFEHQRQLCRGEANFLVQMINCLVYDFRCNDDIEVFLDNFVHNRCKILRCG